MKKIDLGDLKKVSGGNLDDYLRCVKELMKKNNVKNEYELGDYLTQEEWEQLQAAVYK